MPWFYVDDAFADSKPVMRLDRSLRNEAIGLWVRCGAWSAKEETDGHVPLDTVKSFGGTPRLIRALHDQAQLWVESSPESWRISRGIIFGNWEKWQKTKAENEAKRKADAARQANYRSSKKGRGYVAPEPTASEDPEMSQRDTGADTDTQGKDVSRRESQRPDPDPTRPDPSMVTSGGEGTLVDDDPEPPRFCVDHPDDTTERCIPCKHARIAHREWVERGPQREAKFKEAQRLARVNCPRCEGTNTYDGPDGKALMCRPHVKREAS